MQKRICITGIGVINPSGIGKDKFEASVFDGKNSLQKVTRFDCENLPIKIAGQINDFIVSDFVPRRLAMKMDRFAHYALGATELALQDANLDLATIDPFRVGIWFGNNAGGWDICERGLFELYQQGATFVNPWQATAWFPTSPQGYVSIAKSIKGVSKSFVCDRASSASAIHFAMHALARGESDVLLVGGTEAPLTAFGMTCYYETGELAASDNETNLYRPFAKDRKGIVLGEGSTVLILEEYQHALKRKAQIYGEIVCSVMRTDHKVDQNKNFVLAQKLALQQAELSPDDIDLIIPEAAGTVATDKIEAAAINEVFANRDIPVTCPKAGFGHLYGASSATDIAIGLMALKNSFIPPTPNVTDIDSDLKINLILTKQKNNLKNIMVLSRAREGTSAAMIIKAIN